VTVTAAIAKGKKASACAWTANTTARTAGKHVKLARSQPMSGEPVRVVFHLDHDSRLVSVFCSAVEHQAVNAGLEAEAGAQLAKAAGDVCRETILQVGASGSGVDITLDTFPNRIEIAIHSHGQPQPAVGLETFVASGSPAGANGGPSGQELLSRVDRVLYNAETGVARTTLVKFLPTHHE